jgi:hypothetical protein
VSECLCGRPTKGDALCPGCAYSLQVALGDISSYWCDLDTVKGRQTRYGATRGRSNSKPLPVDARFLDWDADGSRLQEAVKSTMATWARSVIEERAVLAGPTHPACLHLSCSTLNRSHLPHDNVPSVCRYLLGHADWIKTQYWAPEILDEVTNVAEQLRRMVDRPADKLFVGYCTSCDESLHARIGADNVDCRVCGATYSVAASRDSMWIEAQDKLATVAEISRAISWLGQKPITADRIYKWVERKRLQQRGHVMYRGREVPTYRLGDVAALVQVSENQQKAG